MHHDYDVLGRCKRCGEHKARFAEDEEPCESEADRLRAKLETREAEIKRLNEALVEAGARIFEFEQVMVWADKNDAEAAAALETALNERDAAHEQIDAMGKRISELEAERVSLCEANKILAARAKS